MAGDLPILKPLDKLQLFAIPVLQSPRKSTPSPIHTTLETDLLLKDLSPEAVLEALRANNATLPTTGTKERVLADSIAETSQYERALGVRAALAGKKVKEWVAELQLWHWPVEASQPASKDGAYWGSLQKNVVLERQTRIERIRDDLEMLEVEDLKNYIRNVHLHPRSRTVSGSSQTSLNTIPYNLLADFHVLVTAMIIQVLPELAILSQLMSDWSVRISVLQKVPVFLRQLEDTQMALESAWTTIGQAGDMALDQPLTRSVYQQIKEILSDRVTDLARQIDNILDTLEGHDDSIPDQWIDDMEDAESDYKNWVVEAERLVDMYELRTALVEKEKQHQTVETSQEDAADPDIFVDAEETLDTQVAGTDAVAVSDAAPALKDSAITPSLFFMRSPMVEQNVPQLVADRVEWNLGLVSSVESQRPQGRRPAPLHLDTTTENIEDGPKSHLSVATASSTGFTDMSSPQIYDASQIQYFKSPMEDHFPVTITRDAEDIPSNRYSSASRFKHNRSASAIEPMTRSRASSIYSELTVNGDDEKPRRPSVEHKPHSGFTIDDQIKELQEEFDEEPQSPDSPNASPTLRVRKVRLPLEPEDRHPEPKPNFEANGNHSTGHIEDKMTDKISRLLTKIPAPIKLAGHSTNVENNNVEALNPTEQTRHQRSATPALTLSPAAPKTKHVSNNDSGVRVYHLHQPGKDMPIKLFIRLVGSEERVMVRVGGGWADLAEYLKEYALHHGRRSVSSSNFELKGLPTAQTAAYSVFDANKSPTSSAAGTPSKTYTPNTGRDTTLGTYTPELHRTADITGSTESKRYSTPTTSGKDDDQPSSVGLAGPKTKTINLSPQKKAWVDGMLSQARHISHEHKKIEDMGDLGKVGSTKRVFIKSKPEGD